MNIHFHPEQITELYFLGAVLLFIIIGVIWGYFSEKKEWNNGHCPRCGARWECFDMDSQGGRGYKCKCPGPAKYGCWMSWGFDKHHDDNLRGEAIK